MLYETPFHVKVVAPWYGRKFVIQTWMLDGYEVCRDAWELAVGGSKKKHRTLYSLVCGGYGPTDLEARKTTKKLLEKLETQNSIRYWLKNNANENQHWNYNHFLSHASLIQKKSVLTAALRKVNNYASDKGTLTFSANKKIRQFLNIGYPIGMIKKVCNKIAATEGNGTWISIRNNIHFHSS